VGADHFFLYDNTSQDEHMQVLAPYIEEGLVTLHDAGTRPGRGGLQRDVYSQCLQEHRAESRWIAFLDLDEFLFSPTQRPLPELLTEYEQWAGVGVNRAWFGTSGHRTKPPGLVIESYTQMMRHHGRSSIKSIVSTTRTLDCMDPHQFLYEEGGFVVDEHMNPIDGLFTDAYTFERLRVNHYYTKSEEECRQRKQERLEQNPAFKEARPAGDEHRYYNQVEDDAILAYLPALRAALLGAGDRGSRLA
jgi:hypothetical protein